MADLLTFSDILDQAAERVGDTSSGTRSILATLVNGTMRRIALFRPWPHLHRVDDLTLDAVAVSLNNDVLELQGRPRAAVTGVPLFKVTADDYAALVSLYAAPGVPVWFMEQNLLLYPVPTPDVALGVRVPVLRRPTTLLSDLSNQSASPEFPQHVYEWIVEGTVLRMQGRMNHELADETQQRFNSYLQEWAGTHL